MKVLLDENLPHELRLLLVGHEVFTVQYLGWSGTKNGQLLARAATSEFEVVVTMDDGIPYEQNLSKLPVAILVISAASNDMDDLAPLVPAMFHALPGIAPRSVTRVP